ncbi:MULTISPECIES: ABC transporter substrate-binding protein [unclassified Acetobacterium]|jgi:branched-chain amino acid transport system substrate-binding protein|uniref:ABC transporter substrate-binding protein n=1 Tax=unclassified Acetobacterium TaxID=2638182 RepID=UPI000DBECE5D|nr:MULTISPECIES: ABC transporter substrate-binding protein [unclassified Acetobacterium]AWW25791.1 hypothetical protein DOZ58_03530 [Acetobacterium sp. KB-1]MDZ5725839.1 ABC transporter substrate-binding protein [Acetobacterium sp. K1/6]
MKKSIITLTLVLALALGVSFFMMPAASVQAKRTVEIGVLLPITGTWKATGTAGETALDAALPFVNDYLADRGMQMVLEIRDTQSNPDKALSELEALKAAGITTVIGPMISDEALAVVQYAKDNKMLLLSPSATATELSQPDTFFRMVGTDASQVDGLTRIMNTVYKKKHLITVFVDDTYGRGYDTYLQQMAPAQGMDVIGTVAIAAENPDLASVAESVKSLAAGADATNTAVVIIAPSQTGADLIKKVMTDDQLSAMKWFASADIIGNPAILTDLQVAAFLEKTGMEGLTLGDKGVSLDAMPIISELLNGATDYSPYAITTWDALWLLADTYAQAPELDEVSDFDTLKANLVRAAGNFRNAFGSFNTMDENGDTRGSKYLRYICIKDGDSYSWNCKGHIVDLGKGEPIIQTIDWKVAADGGKVQVGALLPLTGNRSENGEDIQMILDQAITRFNTYAASVGSDLELALVVEDTGSDNEQAKQAAQKLVDQGVTSIIGPINSTELEAVKPIIDAAGIVAISPLSSSASLSVTDRIYRLVLNDSIEAKALSGLLKQDSIDKLVIIHADDSYGTDMVELMKQAFVGDVMAVAYDPASDDYSATLAQAEAAVETGDAARTAVLTVSYAEIVDLFGRIGDASPLLQVKWYGTDSSALSKAVLADQTAAQNAASVDYTTIDFSPYGDKFDPLYYVINSKLKTDEPLKESLISSFDGIWLLGCAYLSEGTAATPETINTYVDNNGFRGVGGVLRLDKNGDRQIGYYKFYHLIPDEAGYLWENNGIYSQDILKPGVMERW